MGIKRLRGQSRNADLSEAWLKKYGMTPPQGEEETGSSQGGMAPSVISVDKEGS
jgi:hypothetical protein